MRLREGTSQTYAHCVEQRKEREETNPEGSPQVFFLFRSDQIPPFPPIMSSRSQDPSLKLDERLRLLYPAVNEDESPLPRCWSSKDKYNYIGLSQNNLRVQYKGHGKTHKDASSVRATHPIPASCGIYYFEVKIVSKGRDGYMGVGLSAQGVNMNR